MTNVGENRSGGFTILELALVLAITAILATIAVYTYTNLTKKAKRVQAQVALKQLAKTEYLYHTEFDKYTDDPNILNFDTTGFEYYVIDIEASRTDFTGKATGNLDSDLDLDIWVIHKGGEPKAVNLN